MNELDVPLFYDPQDFERVVKQNRQVENDFGAF